MNSKYCLKRHESGQIAIWFILVLVAALVVVIYAFFPQIPQAAIASVLPAPIATETVTVAPSETTVPSVTSTATLVPTETPTQTATAIPTQTETAAPTATITPTPGPTRDWQTEDYFVVYKADPGSEAATHLPFSTYEKNGNIITITTGWGVNSEIEFLERKSRQVGSITEQIVCYRINNAKKCSVVGTILQIFFADEKTDPTRSNIWEVAMGGLYDPDRNIFGSTKRVGLNNQSFPSGFIAVVAQQNDTVIYPVFSDYGRLGVSAFCNKILGYGDKSRRWSYSEANSPIHDVKLEGCPSFEPMP